MESGDQLKLGASEWAGRAGVYVEMGRQGRCCEEMAVSGCHFMTNQIFSVVKRDRKTFSMPFWSVSGRLAKQPTSLSGALQGTLWAPKDEATAV